MLLKATQRLLNTADGVADPSGLTEAPEQHPEDRQSDAVAMQREALT